MYTEITEQTKEFYLHGFFDLGKDAFGTLEVELESGFPGNTEIVIGEVARDGKIVHEPGYRTFCQWVFKTKPGKHTYRFPIPKHVPAYDGFPHCLAPKEAKGEIAPFRYVEVNRFGGTVTVRRTAYFNDWNDQASAFESDNAALNRLWDFCKYSIRATNVFDRYIDGERERMPYEGDAYINQLGHFCHDIQFGIAKKTLEHFFRAGCFTWPTEWLLLTPMIVRDYLYYSGDIKSVKRWIPRLEEKLLGKFMTKAGLLSPASFDQGIEGNFRMGNYKTAQAKIRDIVDWPETERDGYELREVNFVPNCYLYAALKCMHELTGNASYLTRAAALKKAIRKAFLKQGLFVDSVGSKHTSLHSAFFALLSGVAEAAEAPALTAIIRERGMACSVYCAQFLLDACFLNGEAPHALKLMTAEGDRSWLNMLAAGATITMESWGDKWKPNQDWNHPWGAAPANVITRGIAGIRPVAPGFSRFTVKPQPAGLKRFTCTQPTIHGAVTLKYDARKGYELTVPEGTVALVGVKELTAGVHRWK